jgi:hypothetical protein
MEFYEKSFLKLIYRWMKYIKTHENFLNKFFKKEKKGKTYPEYKYDIVKFKYSYGDIVKRIKDGKIGEIVGQDVGTFITTKIVYTVDFGDNTNACFEIELETPTNEEIEFFKDTRNYNL